MKAVKAKRRHVWRGLYEFTERVVGLYILGGILAFMTGFITLEILARLILNYSFVGLVDIVEQMVLLLLFLSLSVVQRERGHITVDLLPGVLNHRRSGPILDCLVLAFSVAIAVLLLVMQSWYCIRSYRQHVQTMVLFWPAWPFVLATMIGIFFYVFRLTIQFVDSFFRAITFRPPKAGKGSQKEDDI
jgi:TRAP-type C4-dicarboxylate transport system permease small subunit